MADTTKTYENIFIKKNAAGDREYIKVPYAILADPPTIPDVSGFMPKSGGTFTGEVTFNKKINLGQGDANCLYLGSDGRLNGPENRTLFGLVSGSATFGHQAYSLRFRGSATRPQYTTDGSNYKDLALKSDIPDVSGKQDKLTAGSNITISGNTISATVPTKTSQLTNDSNFVKSNSGAFTGNLTADNFNSRFSLQSVPYGTAVGENADLNTVTYLSVGNYYCGADAIVSTMTNVPVKRAFMMTVYSPLTPTVDNETTGKWVYRVRKFMTYLGEEYIQSVYSGNTAGTFTYGAWQQIAHKSDIPTKTSELTNDSGYITLDGSVKSVVDYGDTSKNIKIGYSGAGITGDSIKYIAGFTTNDGTTGNVARIKDISKDALKNWLGYAAVATSGSYNDLTDKPTIPSGGITPFCMDDLSTGTFGSTAVFDSGLKALYFEDTSEPSYPFYGVLYAKSFSGYRILVPRSIYAKSSAINNNVSFVQYIVNDTTITRNIYYIETAVSTGKTSYNMHTSSGTFHYKTLN